jgi:hypothetical protein
MASALKVKYREASINAEPQGSAKGSLPRLRVGAALGYLAEALVQTGEDDGGGEP